MARYNQTITVLSAPFGFALALAAGFAVDEFIVSQCPPERWHYLTGCRWRPEWLRDVFIWAPFWTTAGSAGFLWVLFPSLITRGEPDKIASTALKSGFIFALGLILLVSTLSTLRMMDAIQLRRPVDPLEYFGEQLIPISWLALSFLGGLLALVIVKRRSGHNRAIVRAPEGSAH